MENSSTPSKYRKPKGWKQPDYRAWDRKWLKTSQLPITNISTEGKSRDDNKYQENYDNIFGERVVNIMDNITRRSLGLEEDKELPDYQGGKNEK